MTKTRRQVQKSLQALQPQPLPDIFIATIGDRAGVYDAGNNNIYVRELASGQPVVVKNQAVPNIPGRLVKVERQGGALYVIGYWGIYGENEGQESVVPDHSHRWPDPNFVPVEAATIMPFNILPYDGFEVQIFGGIFQKSDGTFGSVANQVFDLSGYQPAAGALIVHFQCNDSGVVSVVEGTEVDVKELLSTASIPVATEISLRIGVRLYAGQESVRRDGQINDFYDWRMSVVQSNVEEGGPFQRNRQKDLALIDGECLHLLDYLTMNTYDIILAGDAALEISGGGGGPGSQAHIVDADGTLADVTDKFNNLLAKLETLRILEET